MPLELFKSFQNPKRPQGRIINDDPTERNMTRYRKNNGYDFSTTRKKKQSNHLAGIIYR